LHEKHNISEVQDYLNNTEITKIIQYSPLVPSAVAENLGIKYSVSILIPLFFSK